MQYVFCIARLWLALLSALYNGIAKQYMNSIVFLRTIQNFQIQLVFFAEMGNQNPTVQVCQTTNLVSTQEALHRTMDKNQFQ